MKETIRVFTTMSTLTPTFKKKTKEGCAGSRYKDFTDLEKAQKFVLAMIADKNCMYFTYEKEAEV